MAAKAGLTVLMPSYIIKCINEVKKHMSVMCVTWWVSHRFCTIMGGTQLLSVVGMGHINLHINAH